MLQGVRQHVVVQPDGTDRNPRAPVETGNPCGSDSCRRGRVGDGRAERDCEPAESDWLLSRHVRYARRRPTHSFAGARRMGLLSDLQGRRVYLDANVFIYALERFSRLHNDAEGTLRGYRVWQFLGVYKRIDVGRVVDNPIPSWQCRRRKALPDDFASASVLVVAAGDDEHLWSRWRATGRTAAIRTPDAIHAATAQLAACDVFLTDDRPAEAPRACKPCCFRRLWRGKSVAIQRGQPSAAAHSVLASAMTQLATKVRRAS